MVTWSVILLLSKKATEVLALRARHITRNLAKLQHKICPTTTSRITPQPPHGKRSARLNENQGFLNQSTEALAANTATGINVYCLIQIGIYPFSWQDMHVTEATEAVHVKSKWRPISSSSNGTASVVANAAAYTI